MKTRNVCRIRSTVMAAIFAVGVTAGCAASDDAPDEVVSRAARSFLAATGSGIDRVLGFEAPTTDWSILSNGPGTLSSSTTRTQGASSLSIQPRGYVAVKSVALSSLGSRVGTALQVDVQFQGTQANPWWWGALTIGVDVPSLGVQASGSGLIANSYDLTNKLTSGWNTLSFNLPAALQTALAGTYSDLTFTITFNVPTNTTGTYLIDNLRFLGGTTPPGPGRDAGVDSGQSCTLPSVPSGLAADPEDGVVGLAWTESAGAVSYKIVRADAAGTSVAFTATGSTYADTAVTNGATYSYTVAAVNVCGQSANSTAVTATPTAATRITLYFPHGVNRDAVVLSANGALSVNDRNKILDQDGNPGAVSNAGAGQVSLGYSTVLGAYSSTGAVTSVGPVLLRSYGSVEGRARSGGSFTLQTGAETIEAPQENVTLTPPNQFSWSVHIPVSTQGAVALEPGQDRTLSPGSYADITAKSNSILRLSAGTYFFASLDLESWSKIHVDKSAGPIEIYVTGNVILRGDWLDDAGPAGDLLLVCLGTQDVSVEQVFQGTIVVPNAKLTLASRTTPYRGTFFGKDLESHQDNVVQALPFGWAKECVQFGCSAPDLCHSAGVCNAQTRQCSDPVEVECKAQGACRGVGICDPDTGTCSDPPADKIGCNIDLRYDGYVDMGGGTYVALFGYDSRGTTNSKPDPNQVVYDKGNDRASEFPPPHELVPGSHPGAYLPRFSEGQTVTWTAGSQSVKATASDPTKRLLPAKVGTGNVVKIGDVTIMIDPDLNPYSKVPTEPTPGNPDVVGPEFKGTLSGQLTIGPTGQSLYTVPISIPPGVAGMAPNLSLAYNSQGVNGIAGQGWALSGLSAIHRCPKTKLQDGYASPVMMMDASVVNDDSDGVCLDGARLIKVASDIPAAKFETDSADFSQIYKQSDDSFSVTTKSGETRFYGLSTNARVSFPRQDAAGNKLSDQVVAIWALEKVIDVWGNYYQITYKDNATTDGLLVDHIDYTGHEDSPGHQDASPFYSVNFAYEPRQDIRHARFRGSSLPMTKRLTTITTARGFYTLKYIDDTQSANASDAVMLPSRLHEVDYCSSIGDPQKDCLKPLIFDWDGGGFSWDRAPAYDLPIAASDQVGGEIWGTTGLQFVDLNADGRLDVVQGRAASNGDDNLKVWTNSGQATKTCPVEDLWPNPTPCPGDTPGSAWVRTGGGHFMPMLAANDGTSQGTLLADFDGDGRPELISDSISSSGLWKSDGSGETEILSSAILDWNASSVPPLSWRAVSQALAAAQPSLRCSDGTSAWSKIDLKKDKVADIDGDGRADIIHLGAKCLFTDDTSKIFVLKTDGRSWFLDQTYSLPTQVAAPDFCDLNRDGLPDICSNLRRFPASFINTGSTSKGDGGTVWKKTSLPFPNDAPYTAEGDVDGDGVYDKMVRNWTTDNPQVETVAFAAGGDYVTDGTDSYLAALKAYTSDLSTFDWPIRRKSLAPGRFQVVDLNSDGLVDIVVNGWADGGRPLINTGSTWVDAYSSFKSWKDANPFSADPGQKGRFWVPDVAGGGKMSQDCVGPVDTPLDAFVDLDGDGIADRLQIAMPTCGARYASYAWLNRFKPPVIKDFPNGLAKATAVDYAVISTVDAVKRGVYTETNTALEQGDLATNYAMAPLRVAASVKTDNGIGGTNTATYQYYDLRGSRAGYGPQGFAKVVVTDDSGLRTTTTYKQGYPFTGRPATVERYNGGPLTTTVSEYDVKTTVSGKGKFVYAKKVTDTAYLQGAYPNTNGSSLPTTTTVTENQFDVWGNPIFISVTTTANATGESYRKTTTNIFDTDNGIRQKRGKVLKTTVETSQLHAVSGNPSSTIRHVTAFEYGSSPTFELTLKKVEPDGGEGIELWTAYGYDAKKYGNLATTTVCASQFSSCGPGATNPQSSALPYRTTTISYDPDDFVASPAGMYGRVTRPSYGYGRYPVKTVNAAGHIEYSAYDPLFGSLIQSTGPNGVQTCTILDALGWQTQQIDRCGAGVYELTTTTYRNEPPAWSDSLTKVVTRTVSPTGGYTQAKTDALGRTIETATLSFMGSPARTNTEYDSLGRVYRTSRPHFDGETVYRTTTDYDWLSRPKTVTQDLGDIDGSGKAAKAIVKTIYQGSSIETHRYVNGTIRRKVETKNALGKVATIQDEAGTTLHYFYDVEGNLTDTSLTDTIDTSKNVHIEYDQLGRKKKTKDPDLGEWTYGYNGFGELISQTDGKRKPITMSYDVLGRLVSKTDETGTAEWVYDVASGVAGKGKLAAMVSAPDMTGKLSVECSIPYVTQVDGNRVGRSYSYGPFGEVLQVDECVDGETFTTKFRYDTKGRQETVTYPAVKGSSLTTKYKYTSIGFLQAVVDPSNDSPYWALLATDASGQVKDEILRSGVETVSKRNPSTGWLMEASTSAMADNQTQIQGWKNTYDEAGNLRSRTLVQPAVLSDSTETFGYDPLDRLTSSQVKIAADGYRPAQESFHYDSIGNLTQKGGQTYSYTGCAAGGGIHTVCKIGGGAAFSYDANGNLTAGNGREISYTPSNKVSHIKGQADGSVAAPTVDFVYGADGNRVVQVSKSSAGSESRTVYVGLGGTGKSMYERTTSPDTIEHVHFLYAGSAHGGNAFALSIIKENRNAGTSEQSMRYHHFDHLGSITATTGSDGKAIATAIGFDSWGRRRSADGRPDPGNLALQPGHREYTGHEAIPDVGLVNMNGRVYDPDVGRFLSPDPNVQFVANLQSFNRYSYAANNPLRYTDPTGYFFGPVFDIAVNATILVAGASICATAGPGCVVAFTLAAAIYNTTSAHYANGAGWGSAITIGLISMAASGVVGTATGPLAANGSFGAKILVGAISGTMVAGFMTPITGGDLGTNLLTGAFSGAVSAALVAAATEGQQPLSQASAANMRGGGGSDAAAVEASEVGGAQQGGDGGVLVACAHGLCGIGAGSINDDGKNIAAVARSTVGSTDYLQGDAAGGYPAGANKCNKLPADVVEEAGLPRPQVPRGGLLGWLGFTRDPTSNEWADPNVKIPGWSSPHSVNLAMEGDVVAQQHNSNGPWGHVGVVVGPQQTVSVSSLSQPAGIVTMSDWGFRPTGLNGEAPTDPSPVVRTYRGVP